MISLNEFNKQLLNHLIELPQESFIKYTVIKKHTDKLHVNGDLSFPINLQNWKTFLSVDKPEVNILNYKYIKSDNANQNDIIQNAIDDLIKASINWKFSIQKSMIVDDRCVIFLNRFTALHSVIKIVYENEDYCRIPKSPGAEISFYPHSSLENCEQSIVEYRRSLIESVLKNLVAYSKYNTTSIKDSKCILNVNAKSSSSSKLPDFNCKNIICGTVQNPTIGNKLAVLSAKDYIEKRSVDMQLMAQHKYGIRVQNEQIFIDMIKTLGVAAATFDLVEVKHSSPVTLIMGGSAAGTSKGASFVLYNSARLETLFDTFERKVKEGVYPKLPEFENIDICLLKEEEEWTLLFNYILEFPNIIERSVGDIENAVVAPHLLCNFLSKLVGIFSVYYRRVRILTENRKQLLPTMFARIYLLNCVRNVLNKGLGFLNINPAQHM